MTEPTPWKVVPHVTTARSGRQRRRFTVERGSEVVYNGFSDDPMIYRKRVEAQETADRLNRREAAP